MQTQYVRIFSVKTICDYLPPAWEIRNNLLVKGTRNLVVFSVPLTDELSIKRCLKFIYDKSEIKLTDYVYKLREESLLNKFKNNTKSLFISFKEIKNFSCIFIDSFTSLLDDFKHEFIHYYQKETGDDINKIEVDLNKIYLPENIELIYPNKQLLAIYLKKIINENEFSTYVNEFIDQLIFNDFIKINQIKPYFKKLTQYDCNNEVNEIYIQRMSTTELFKCIKNTNQNLIPFTMFVLMNCYQSNLGYIQSHLLQQLEK